MDNDTKYTVKAVHCVYIDGKEINDQDIHLILTQQRIFFGYWR